MPMPTSSTNMRSSENLTNAEPRSPTPRFRLTCVEAAFVGSGPTFR